MGGTPSDWKIDGATGRMIAPDRDIVGLRGVAFQELKTQTSGGAVVIDWNTGLKHHVLMTGDISISFVGLPGPSNGVLILEQDGTGGHSVNWPANARAGDGKVQLSGAPGSVSVLGLASDGPNFHISSTPNSTGPVTTELVP